eukprot:m.20352 g.20352  ORF g.20352 m.20352 type:complete len:100 (-) comp8155_c1_seq1:870-1169(-)
MRRCLLLDVMPFYTTHQQVECEHLCKGHLGTRLNLCASALCRVSMGVCWVGEQGAHDCDNVGTEGVLTAFIDVWSPVRGHPWQNWYIPLQLTQATGEGY